MQEKDISEKQPYFEKCLETYNNSLPMAKSHIVASRWLRDCEFSQVELAIIGIIAEYCKWIEFTWDNFNSKTSRVEKGGILLVIPKTGPGSQRITSNTGFSRGKHILKVKQLLDPGGCSRSFGISSVRDIHTKEETSGKYRSRHCTVHTLLSLSLVHGPHPPLHRTVPPPAPFFPYHHHSTSVTHRIRANTLQKQRNLIPWSKRWN